MTDDSEGISSEELLDALGLPHPETAFCSTGNPEKMGPLQAGHPALDGDHLPCGRCLQGFEEGQYVTLDLLPVTDPEQAQKAAAGRPHRAEGLLVHWDCVINSMRAKHYPGLPWWYMSFATTDDWLGGCYLQAPSAELTPLAAYGLDCNPGGQIAIVGPFTEAQMERVPEADRNRLLTMRTEIDP
jgi:hypothetical protein